MSIHSILTSKFSTDISYYAKAKYEYIRYKWNKKQKKLKKLYVIYENDDENNEDSENSEDDSDYIHIKEGDENHITSNWISNILNNIYTWIANNGILHRQYISKSFFL